MSSSATKAKSATAARVAAEALRVGGERPRLAAELLPDPDEDVGDRPPGAERPPDVAEQQREHGHAEPEDDVDPRRRDVPERVGRADERGGEDDDEEEIGERLDDDSHRAEDEPAERLAEVAASRVPVELRRLPERPEQDERDDEHEGAAPVEQPLGNGEVLDPPDPVGEDVREELRGSPRTVSCASSASIGWSSRAKRPGTLATNWITVGTPFLTFFSML